MQKVASAYIILVQILIREFSKKVVRFDDTLGTSLTPSRTKWKS
jgi:hypothetical protein